MAHSSHPANRRLNHPLQNICEMRGRLLCCCLLCISLSVSLCYPPSVHLVSITLSSPSTLLVSLLLFVIRCEFTIVVPYLSMYELSSSPFGSKHSYYVYFCCSWCCHRVILVGRADGVGRNGGGDKLYRVAAINLRNAINIPSVRLFVLPVPPTPPLTFSFRNVQRHHNYHWPSSTRRTNEKEDT